MKFNKNWAKKFNKDGYILFNNLINKKDLKEISKRLKYLSKKQKDGRGLSEPGTDKSLIHSLHKDQKLKKIIEEKNWFKLISCGLLDCELSSLGMLNQI